MLVRNRRRKHKFSRSVPKNGMLPHCVSSSGVGRVYLDCCCGSAARHLLQGIEDIQQAGRFDDPENEGEKNYGQQGKLHGGRSALHPEMALDFAPW